MDLASHPDFVDRDGMNGHVLLAMGQAGVPTRVLAARLGNRWTYAGDGVAPGQMPAARLLGEFGFRRIRAGRRRSTASSATRSRTRCRR